MMMEKNIKKVCVYFAMLFVLLLSVSLHSGCTTKDIANDVQNEQTTQTDDIHDIISSFNTNGNITDQLKNANIGDVVTLGSYSSPGAAGERPIQPIQWVILNKENGKAFLISKEAVANRQFNYDQYQVAYVHDTWEYSSIRKWLNDDFYNKAFSDEDKKYIVESDISNYCYSGKAMDCRNTYDHIFLLSVGEAEKYCHLKQVGMFADRSPKSWLRSPGSGDYAPSNMDYGSHIDYDGSFSSYSMDIYPCTWVQYSDDVENQETDSAKPPEQGRVLQSGKSGEVIWELDDKGILTISGSGAMEDYLYYMDRNICPWADYRYKIYTVVVEDGVTQIGYDSFNSCSYLKEAYIAGSVTTIGSNSFVSCDALEKLVISEGVQEIGSSAFQNCSSLKSVTVPNGVITIGDYAFRNCGLITAELPDSITSMRSTIFVDCNHLESVNGIDAEDWLETNFHKENGYYKYPAS